MAKPDTSIPKTSFLKFLKWTSAWLPSAGDTAASSSALLHLRTSGDTSAMCTVAFYVLLRDLSTIWQGPHETSRGFRKTQSFHCLQSTHCAFLALSLIIALHTIFGCRWLWDHLMRTYMVAYSILFMQSHQAVTIAGFISGLLEEATGCQSVNLQH